MSPYSPCLITACPARACCSNMHSATSCCAASDMPWKIRWRGSWIAAMIVAVDAAAFFTRRRSAPPPLDAAVASPDTAPRFPAGPSAVTDIRPGPPPDGGVAAAAPLARDGLGRCGLAVVAAGDVLAAGDAAFLAAAAAAAVRCWKRQTITVMSSTYLSSLSHSWRLLSAMYCATISSVSSVGGRPFSFA